MIVAVKAGQSLVDVAMQYCGDIDRVVEIAELNSVDVDWVASEERKMLVPDVKNAMSERIRNSEAVFCTGEI